MKVMKKGLFCILVCMLVIAGSTITLPASIVLKNTSQLQIHTNRQYAEGEKLFNELQVKLDKVTKKQEVLTLIREVLVELKNFGLLPKGMTVKQAQRLVTDYFSKLELKHPFQSTNENNSGNTNCLVIGFANETFFRPYPTIYDIPIIYYLRFNTSFGEYFNFLIWFYAIRATQPLKLGPYAWVGGKGRLVENGNVTQEYTHASSGWVWSLGSNGLQTWNGTFYGGLNTRYQKIIIDNESYVEDWNPVGIIGFVGMNFFSLRTFWNANKLPTFYIGFAREINLTYTPPWS